MKKLLFTGLIATSLVLTASQDTVQKNYKKLLDYFALNRQEKCSLKGIMPEFTCSDIKSLSKEDFYTLLDTIDQGYDCGIVDYLNPQDQELCVNKYKKLNAIVGLIDECRSIESYLYSRGCHGTEYGICSSLFKK